MHDRAPEVKPLQGILEGLAAEGFIEERSFEALARLLWGAFFEAGLSIAHADDREAARNEMADSLDPLFRRAADQAPATRARWQRVSEQAKRFAHSRLGASASPLPAP